MKKLYKSRAFWIVIAFLSSVSLWMVVAIVQPLIILSHTACKVIVCYYCVLRS